MVVVAVAIEVEDVRETVWVGYEGFRYEAMHLEVLSLDADASVALAVEGGDFAEWTSGGSAGHTAHTSREDAAIVGDEVGRIAFLPELDCFGFRVHIR